MIGALREIYFNIKQFKKDKTDEGMKNFHKAVHLKFMLLKLQNIHMIYINVCMCIHKYSLS